MKNIEKMLYQENKLGSSLVVLFIVLNMAYTIFNLKNMPVEFSLGVFVMFNIILSLVGFLASTKMKVYLVKWGYFGILLSIVQVFRVANIPEGYETLLNTSLVVLVLTSAVALFAGSLITIIKSGKKTAYENDLKSQQEG